MPFSVETTMDLRNLNKKKVFGFLCENSPTTRKDMVSGLGLSFGTIATICKELITEGLMSSASSNRSNGGRIPDLVFLKPDGAYVACLDLIQHEKTSLYFYDLAGKLISCEHCDTSGVSDYAALEAQVLGAYQRIVAQFAHAPQVVGMGIAVPAIPDRRTGLLIHSTNPILENVALASRLESALAIKVVVENESNLLASACVHNHPISRALTDLIYLYGGEGLGAGIICNDKLLLGARGLGGEINHLPIGRRNYQCYCGQKNCVETELGIAGFLKKYREDSGQDLGNDSSGWHRFKELVAKNDGCALAVCQENAHILGALLASLCNLFDPQRVYLGGYVTDVYESMQTIVKQELAARNVSQSWPEDFLELSYNYQDLLLKGCRDLVTSNWIPRANSKRKSGVA